MNLADLWDLIVAFWFWFINIPITTLITWWAYALGLLCAVFVIACAIKGLGYLLDTLSTLAWGWTVRAFKYVVGGRSDVNDT